MGSLEVEAVLAARDMSRRVKEQYNGKYGCHGGEELSDNLRLFKAEVFDALERHKSEMISALIEQGSRTKSACSTSRSSSPIRGHSPSNTQGSGQPSYQRAKSARPSRSLVQALEAEVAAEEAATELQGQEAVATTAPSASTDALGCTSALHWAQVGESKDAAASKRFNAESYRIRSEWDTSTGTVKRMARANTYYVDPEAAARKEEATMATIREKMARDAEAEATAAAAASCAPAPTTRSVSSPQIPASIAAGGWPGGLSMTLPRGRPYSAMPASGAAATWDAAQRRRAAGPPLPPTSSGRFSSLLRSQTLTAVSRSRPTSAVYAKVQSRLLHPTTSYLRMCHHSASEAPPPAPSTPPSRVQSARPVPKLRPASAPSAPAAATRSIRSAVGSQSGRAPSAAEAEEEEKLNTVCIVPIREESSANIDAPKPCFTIKPKVTFNHMLKSFEATY